MTGTLHGPPHAPFLQGRLESVRLRLEVELPSGCWIWQGHRNANGYGRVGIAGSTDRVHRVVFRAYGTPIPDGMVLDHICHDPATCAGGPTCTHRACANPLHLTLTTRARNRAADRSSPSGAGAGWARTGRCKRGHDVTDPANLIRRSDGGRQCRACERIARKRGAA
jgi:hypothetical protein